MIHPVLFCSCCYVVEIRKMIDTIALRHQNAPSIAVIPEFYESPYKGVNSGINANASLLRPHSVCFVILYSISEKLKYKQHEQYF